MITAATCATLAAMLAAAQPGGTVELKGDCRELVISNRFPRVVTIDARKATVRGLRLTGENITWLGGELGASGGVDGKGPKGYAVFISGTNIRLSNALVSNARRGVVIDQARNVTIEGNKFWRLREDGIIASRWVNGTIDDNAFYESQPRPTQCVKAGGIVTGLPRRLCVGVWTDGDHADAVQLRNGVVNVRIRRNTVAGETNGIGQMDTAGDAPLERILIAGNNVVGAQFHSITLYDCRGCRIEGNKVRRGHAERKAVIRAGQAVRCGNDVQDDKPERKCAL